VVEFPWGRASDPAGVALSPWRSFGLLRGLCYLVYENAIDVHREDGLKTRIGSFCAGVATYSRWSERRLPQTEYLAGNPSENSCPVRWGRL